MDTTDANEKIGYASPVSEHFYERIEKLIETYNVVGDYKQTKQRFITEALIEKLEELKKHSCTPAKETILRFTINKRLNEKILEEIEKMRISHYSYSKKKWIIEAISEKLERDEKKVKSLLNFSKKQKRKKE